MNILWSEQAKGDLLAIRDFIARDSEHYASVQVEKLLTRIEHAAKMPSRGHPLHEFAESGIREVHEGNYRIIYRAMEDELQVITIVHMRQKVTRRRLR